MEPPLQPNIVDLNVPTASRGDTEEADRAELTRLTIDNHRELFSYILFLVNDPDLAWDIAQDVSVTAWEKRSTRDRTRPALPWLKAIALNKVRDHFKKLKRKKRGTGRNVTVVHLRPGASPETVSYSEVFASAGLEPWQEAAHNERDKAVLIASELLSQRDQRILWAHYRDRLSAEEIAVLFDLTTSAVTGILYRARRKIESKLKSMGFSDESSEVNRFVKGDSM